MPGIESTQFRVYGLGFWVLDILSLAMASPGIGWTCDGHGLLEYGGSEFRV